MLKWIKVAIALLLLPVCLGFTHALLRVIEFTGQATTIWVASLSGAACWLVVYLMLPVYVIGHELTHALWTWAFGGRVLRWKATSKGGYVVVSKNNFLITLAPYFFPIYTTAVIGGFLIGDLVWGWREHVAYFHFMVGATYAFHVTLTWHVLQQRQSDITDQGYLFSAMVVWLTNIAILLSGIPLLTGKIGVLQAWGWGCIETGKIFQRVSYWL
jgi:hypothetical protein